MNHPDLLSPPFCRDHWQFDRTAYRAACLAPALRAAPRIACAALALVGFLALFLAVLP